MASFAEAILTELQSGPKLTRQIAVAVGASNIRRCLKGLCDKGYVCRGEGVYSISDKGRRALAGEIALPLGGPCAERAVSRQNVTLRDKAWRTMQRREFVSLDDILTLHCDESNAKSASDSLASWLLALRRAGYTADSARKSPGDTKFTRRFRLVKNTGPLAPAWNKAKRLLTDPNTGEIHKIPGGRSGMA
ncbi:winged helix-turn-helix domain-containing protein [Desulfovibrio sp. OttesenSCG-928-G15]|nr:winged helix-turn-helix domain-containing protein [Desulfovibrio sp. OttesenSCG-928-G15]